MKKLIFLFLLAPLFCAGQVKMFMVAGQSNARGAGNSTQSVVPATGTAFEYWDASDTLIYLLDPVGENFGSWQQAATGSAWTAFADQYHKITGDTVIIIQCGKGGSHLVQSGWSGALSWQSVYKAQSAMNYTGLPLSGVIWLQGESDATALNNGQISQEQYRAELDTLIQYYRTEIDSVLPFFIIPIGLNTSVSDSGFNAIRAAQYEVAANDSLTWTIFDSTNLFPSLGLMSDPVHYSQEGYTMAGRGAARNIAKILASDCPPTDPIRFEVCFGQNPSPGFVRVFAPGVGAYSVEVQGFGFSANYSGGQWGGFFNVPCPNGLFLARISVGGGVFNRLIISP